MASLYHSLFTEIGLELLRTAIQSGTKLGITHMSFGDGNGVLPTPDAKFTSMVKEVYRVQLNRLAPSKENANWLEADGVIPSAVGGFNIREVGLWAGDVMVAYANYPPTYKPTGDQGTAQIKTIRIVLQIDNTANFELKIDASVVMATIQSVQEAKQDAIKYSDDTKISTVASIASLLDLEQVDGRSVWTKSYYENNLKGSAQYRFDSSKVSENNGITNINGWILQLSDDQIDCFVAGFKADGTDETNRMTDVYNLSLKLYIPENTTIASKKFNKDQTFGNGHVDTSILKSDALNFYNPRIPAPYCRPSSSYGWTNYAEARGNLEHGCGSGLIVNNPDLLPQVSGYTTLAGMASYGSTDLVAQFIHMTSQKHDTINQTVTYTSTSVKSPQIISGINVKIGDYLRTATDTGKNATWRGWVKSIDFATNTIVVHGWATDNGTIGTPPNGLSFITPDAVTLWGQNTVVYLEKNRPAYKSIGYELNLYCETGRYYETMDGFYAVNLNSSNRATSAFKASGGWSTGFYAKDTLVAVKHVPMNATDIALNVHNDSIGKGKILSSTVGSEERFAIDWQGITSQTRKKYGVVQATRTITILEPSVWLVNVVEDNVIINLPSTPVSGTVYEFKNISSKPVTINGKNDFTHTLQVNGYVRIFTDTTFYYLFM